jgi:hypothetical protein
VAYKVIREWRNLFKSANSDIVDAFVFSFLKKSVIHLAYKES